MIRKVLNYLLAIMVLLGGISLWYFNSLTRIEYEHCIYLPSNTKIIENKSEWWILNSDETERQVKSLLYLPNKDFMDFLIQGKWARYELINDTPVFKENIGESLLATQTFYKGDEKRKSVRQWIKIVTINYNLVSFELLTTVS